MITARVNNSDLVALIRQIQAKGKNTRPALAAIAGVVMDSAEENFERQGRPGWPQLSDVTRKRRAEAGKTGKILQVSGRLAASISPRVTNSQAIVGTNVKYAATQQFGARKGQYGRDKHGRPIPWGNVPARPFLVFQDEDTVDMQNILLRHLLS